MKKKLVILALLLAAALLLGACAAKQDSGEKKLTAKDIEGTWIVSDSSTRSKDGNLSLDNLMLKPDVSAVLIFKDGKITWEWEAQDGKKTADEGSYEVSDGNLFFSGVRIEEAKLEGKTLTLTELAPPAAEGSNKEENSKEQPTIEIADKAVLILERK